MVFFKCEAVRENALRREELREEMQTLSAQLANRSAQLCRDFDDKSMVFTVSLQVEAVTLAVIASSPDEAQRLLNIYLHQFPTPIRQWTMEEITFQDWSHLLGQAERCDYVAEADELLERFHLSHLRHRRHIVFSEAMIDTNAIYSQQKRMVQEHLFGDTMLPELARIRQGAKQKNVVGHPVHYLLSTDDRNTRAVVYQTLLTTLYKSGRIRNRRFAYVDCKEGGSVPAVALDELYHCNDGGAVVIRYTEGQDAEEESNNRGENLMETLSAVASRYKHRVLTILCLPCTAGRAKEIFRQQWSGGAFVELQEDVIDSARAQRYLRKRAKQHHVYCERELIAAVRGNATYTVEQLNRVFDQWHEGKLHHHVYPQYGAMVAAKTAGQPTVSSAYDQLQGLIGLGEAKAVIQRALNFFKAQKLFADRGMSTEHPSMHMVFTGNPGSAKTTVARLFAEVMREQGILARGTVHEVGRADLVGRYVGHTAPLVKAAFAKARGGVLFIDEAYSLVDDRNGLFGDEAINTIVQEMENCRHDTIVIFAGYPDKMEEFLDRNPGLRSRIAFHVPFADYTVDELCAIADHIAARQGLTLTAEATQKLRGVFAVASKQEGYGNGRYVRNRIERARMAQADRLMSGEVTVVTDEQLHTITAEDIEVPQDTTPVVTPIGFCA